MSLMRSNESEKIDLLALSEKSKFIIGHSVNILVHFLSNYYHNLLFLHVHLDWRSGTVGTPQPDLKVYFSKSINERICTGIFQTVQKCVWFYGMTPQMLFFFFMGWHFIATKLEEIIS